MNADALLDMSQDELTIKETQLGDSPATFSRNLVDRFKIIGHNTQTGSETVNSTDNKIRINAKATPINDNDYNCHITPIEFV